MLNPNEIIIDERGYHSLTLSFKDPNLEVQYLNQIKIFSILKKINISKLALIQYSILIILLLVLTYRNNHKDHENITLAMIAYMIFLFFNYILLNLNNIESFYQPIKIAIPLMNLILNIICLVFYESDDAFSSIMALFILVQSVIFQSEYIEKFIHYFGLCMILCILFFVK